MRTTLGIACVCLLAACSKEERRPASTIPTSVEVKVTEPHLRFTYLGKDGRFQLAQRLDEVPQEARRVVMIVDLSQHAADSDDVLVVDASRPAASGRAVARRMDRAAFERLARGALDAVRPPVTMYATAWCGVCRQARAFLQKHGIVWTEHDVEKEPEAARTLRERAARAGVDARGVPVFDIGGQIIAGFNEERLRQLLKL